MKLPKVLPSHRWMRKSKHRDSVLQHTTTWNRAPPLYKREIQYYDRLSRQVCFECLIEGEWARFCSSGRGEVIQFLYELERISTFQNYNRAQIDCLKLAYKLGVATKKQSNIVSMYMQELEVRSAIRRFRFKTLKVMKKIKQNKGVS